MRRSGAILAFVAATALGAGAPASAILTQFRMSTTVDATSFGLGAAQHAVIEFRYDPATVPIVYQLGMPTVRIAYGPVPGRLLVGSDVVVLEGQLAIDDDNGGVDAYDYGAATFVEGETVSGAINGVDIRLVEVRFIDQEAAPDMLLSLAPPPGTSFQSKATFALFDFRGFGSEAGTRTFDPPFSGFVFSAPEPDAIALGAAALAALALQRRRYSSCSATKSAVSAP
jgi:hypothetical protein